MGIKKVLIFRMYSCYKNKTTGKMKTNVGA